MRQWQLQYRRKHLDLTIRQMAIKVGMSASQLSKIENGGWPNQVEDLVNIVEAYDLPRQEVEREWLLQLATTPNARAHLASLISNLPTPDADPGQIGLLADLSALNADTVFHSAALKVLNALVQVQKRRNSFRGLDGGTVIRDCDLNDQSQYTGLLTPKGKVRTKWLYGTSRPARFLIELHQILPQSGAYHRQPATGTSTGGLEIFSIMRGMGILLLRDSRGWNSWDLEPGGCGFYDGGKDHVWINLSAVTPLITFNIFFPHSAGSPLKSTVISPNGKIKVIPGTACEFSLPDLPTDLPEEVRVQVRQCVRDRGIAI